MNSLNTKQEFLVSEMWILSWNASVQHAGIYREGAKDRERRDFRDAVIAWTKKNLLDKYKKRVPPESHEENIESLAEAASEIGKDLLRSGGYRIGTAQKLLNLQLKYLWCLGLVARPPQCPPPPPPPPVDSIILKKLNPADRVSWTQITEIEVYRRVIGKLEELASSKGESLAQWELEEFDRKDR